MAGIDGMGQPVVSCGAGQRRARTPRTPFVGVPRPPVMGLPSIFSFWSEANAQKSLPPGCGATLGAMSDTTTPTPPTKSTVGLRLRLPPGLATKLRERSFDSGDSMNELVLKALDHFLRGGLPDRDRLERLERDLEQAAQDAAEMAGLAADIDGRLKKIERLANQQSY